MVQREIISVLLCLGRYLFIEEKEKEKQCRGVINWWQVATGKPECVVPFADLTSEIQRGKLTVFRCVVLCSAPLGLGWAGLGWAGHGYCSSGRGGTIGPALLRLRPPC